MITIVPSMCSKIKCYRESLLTGCKICLVKRVTFLNSAKSCILSYSPWSRTVHCCQMTSFKRKLSRYFSRLSLWVTPVILGVNWLYKHLFIGLPYEFLLNIELSFCFFNGHFHPPFIKMHLVSCS